jgi:hypothetical protein
LGRTPIVRGHHTVVEGFESGSLYCGVLQKAMLGIQRVIDKE